MSHLDDLPQSISFVYLNEDWQLKKMTLHLVLEWMLRESRYT